MEVNLDAGIDVSKLEEGTKVIVETKKSIYEITIVKDSQIKIIGGILPNGEFRFPTPVDAIFAGSSKGLIVKQGWIGKGMKLEIIIDDKALVTSAVKTAEIEAADGRWKYSMDW